MKQKKEVLTGLLVIIALILGGIGLYTLQKFWNRNSLAARIAALGGRGGPPPSIAGLREAIAIYEDQIETHVKDAAQTGVYWKILATRLQDKGLHIEALDALESAIHYNPEDPALQYMTGISAAMVAKSYLDIAGSDPGGTARYYTLAENAYLNAIALDETYARPRYGLGVLYVFELNRPEQAVPHLLRFLELTHNDVDGMIVLAGAYYMTEQYALALELYDRIIALTKDAAKKRDAEMNRQAIMDKYYG